MTSRCLWHACRALILGSFLMAVGAGMATIGYYAEHIAVDNYGNSSSSSTPSSSLYRTKGESRSIHLHNLSYAGPIVMGCGGFIIVAACVMTFEARDSAGKVVPARFKLSTTTRANGTRANSTLRSSGTTHAVGSQTNRWDTQIGVYRSAQNDSAYKRVAETAALVHFSKMLGSPRRSEQECSAVQRSGSVPNLSSINQSPTHQTTVSPSQTRHGTRHGREHGILKNRSPNRSHLDASHLHRLGTSFDETRPTNVRVSPTAMSNVHPSRAERNKVSDTAKRHILARQKKVDNFELQSAKNFKAIKNRSNSTNSDTINVFRRRSTNFPVVARTRSVNSRGIQTDHLVTDKKPNKTTARSSIPSADMKFSQISICSEPTHLTPFQISIDQCFPEETPSRDEQITIIVNDNVAQSNESENGATTAQTITAKRPNTLCVNGRSKESAYSERKRVKHLYRSNSSSLHKRSPKLISPTSIRANDKYKLSRELDRIYFISSNKDDENYDSIEVIDERRMKNLPKSERSRLYKSNTFICEEYYSSGQATAAATADGNSNGKKVIAEGKGSQLNREEKCVSDGEKH